MNLNTELIKGFLLGTALIGAVVLSFFLIYREFRTKKSRNVEEDSLVILQHIENVSKLVLVESMLSEVYTYSESEKFFFNLIPTEKKAVVILKAKVQIAYDLRKMKFKIDKDTKTLQILSLPNEEIMIAPDLKFFDVKTSTFTSFTPEDINKVQDNAKQKIELEIEKSGMKRQAKLRLEENLGQLLALSTGLGWKIENKSGIALDFWKK